MVSLVEENRLSSRWAGSDLLKLCALVFWKVTNYEGSDPVKILLTPTHAIFNYIYVLCACLLTERI